MDSDSDPRGPKTYGSYGAGSATQPRRVLFNISSSHLVHHAAGPGKGRENQDAGPPRAARHKLLRHQVHPVPERRHQRHVRVPVETGQLGLPHAPVDVPDGRPAGRGEAAVDGADELVHLLLEVLVLADVGAAGDGHLEEDHPLQVGGVLAQQPLVSLEPVHQAFRVVQPVNAQDDLHR
jgi:hypothetical protein